MKRFRQIVEISPPRSSAGSHAGSRYYKMQRKSIIGKPVQSGKKSADEALKSVLKKMDDYYAKKGLKEGKLSNWQIDQAEKRGVPEKEITNDDLRNAWLRRLRVSPEAKKVLPDDELKKMDAEKDKTIAKIKALREAKKWKPGEGWRKLRAAKKAAKAAPPKKKTKPVAKKVEKPVTTRVDDKHPLEHILKNENKDLRAKLMQVHPADRGRLQKLIANPEKAKRKLNIKV